MCLTVISTTSRVWPVNLCASQPPIRSSVWWTEFLTGLMKVEFTPAFFKRLKILRVDNNSEYRVHALRKITANLVIFENRGSALDICCPLVVHGWSQTSVPCHQQLCHTCDGNTSLPGWSLPIQCYLSLPKGKKGVKTQPDLGPGSGLYKACSAKIIHVFTVKQPKL